jgi:polysaccharide export outer membrane protein
MIPKMRKLNEFSSPPAIGSAAEPVDIKGRNKFGRVTKGAAHIVPIAALCLSLLCASAHAQFNGSTSLGTTEINRPISLTTDTSILYPTEPDLVLAPGDLVTIRIFADTDYNPIARIAPDGTILLPLIGIVHLQGLSVTKAEQLIAEKLVADGMYRDPQVSLQITEGPNSVVTVAGEVHGVIPVVGSRRLLDVLTAAGGLPATASHIITINRPGLANPIVVDLGSDPLNSSLGDIPVLRGDTIIVSRIGIVYVLGAFKASGVIPLNAYTPLTLTELTSLSGGIQFAGRFKDLRIIRTVGNSRTVAVYDIKKVLDGKAPDPILQSNDIVYLPIVPIKEALSSGGLASALGLVTLAITVARF